MTSINERLRMLRKSAQPAMSMRQMAEALGLTHAGYHNYESVRGFKQPFLPMDLARRIARLLADRGVNPDDVLALAGIGIDEASTPALSAAEERLVYRYRQLAADERELLLRLADKLDSGGSSSTGRVTLQDSGGYGASDGAWK